MSRRLILDTNALIAFERRSFEVSALDDDDVAICALTVAEFRVGIELARNAEQGARRSRVLEGALEAITMLDYTDRTAAEHARLIAHTRRSGSPRGAHDLIIAAHASADARTIVSFDAHARFADLPGVAAIAP